MKNGRRRRAASVGGIKSYAFRHRKSVLILILPVWIGIVFGAVTYRYAVSSDTGIAPLLQEWFMPSVIGEWGLSVILSEAFWWLAMTVLLFLFGQCAFGWPLMVLELLMIGFRLGMDQCLWYQYYGWSALVCVACLPSLCYAAITVGMSYECMALSLLISKGVIAHRARPIAAQNEFLHCCLWLLFGSVWILICAAAQTGLPILLGL